MAGLRHGLIPRCCRLMKLPVPKLKVGALGMYGLMSKMAESVPTNGHRITGKKLGMAEHMKCVLVRFMHAMRGFRKFLQRIGKGLVQNWGLSSIVFHRRVCFSESGDNRCLQP